MDLKYSYENQDLSLMVIKQTKKIIIEIISTGHKAMLNRHVFNLT